MAERKLVGTAILKLPETNEFPRAEAANFFHFAYAGGDVQMLIGYVDPTAIHAARLQLLESKGGPPTLAPSITHRIAMSREGFERLESEVKELKEKLNAPAS